MAEDSSDTLTGKQKRAVAALLSERSIGDAAQVAGVGERTLHAWLKQEPFKQALRDARNLLLVSTISRLSSLQASALDTLEYLSLQAENEHVRMSSAKALLEAFTKYRLIEDFDSRIAALEQLAAKQEETWEPDI